MDKPLAVLSKNPNSKHHEEDVDMETDFVDNTDSESDITYFVKAIIRRKLFFKTRPKPIIANVPKKL